MTPTWIDLIVFIWENAGIAIPVAIVMWFLGSAAISQQENDIPCRRPKE